MRGPITLASVLLLSAIVSVTAAADTQTGVEVTAHIEEFHEGAVLPHDAAMHGVLTIMNLGSTSVTYTVSESCPIDVSVSLPNGQNLWSSNQRHLCSEGTRDIVLGSGESIALYSDIISFDEIDVIPMGDIHINLELSKSGLSDYVVMRYSPEARLDGLHLMVEAFAEDEVMAGSSLEFNLMMQSDDVNIWNRYQGDCRILTTVIPMIGLPITSLTDVDCIPDDTSAVNDLLRHIGWLSVSTILPNGDLLSEGDLRVIIEAGTLREEFYFTITPPSRSGAEYLELSIEGNKVLLNNNAPFRQSFGDSENRCNLVLDRINQLGSTILSSTTCSAESSQIERESSLYLGIVPSTDGVCLGETDGLRLTLAETSLDVLLEIPDNLRCLSSQINDVLNDELVTLDRTITTTLNADGTIMHWSVQWPDVRGECEIRIRTYGAHASAFGSTTTSSCELASLQDNTWQLSGDHPTLINDIMIAAKIHVTVAESDVGTIHQSVLKYSPVLVSTETTGFAENADSGNPTDMRTTGSWMWRTSANEGCWYFDEHPSWVFIGTSVDGWEPKPGRTGTYSMVVASDLHDYCSGLTVNVVEVTSETVDSEKILASSSEANEEPGFPIPITPTAVAVTTSISIFAILLGYLNVESIRMPLSRWGWVFAVGAVRRKPRDGAYQRGRIMGYLQANPGVHFRALLNALEMSNGHLAHHLRVLEEREQLWKRRAGRRVLIYPSTISKNLDEDRLPVPIFSPDPSSTQGRILTLLVGDEHNIGRSMTQRELSTRLDASQQLVSHHLRTLQSYGLIDHDRRGVRNVYFPTSQARMLYAERYRASN